MSNMSYCRFENTSRDLRDCRDALQELFNGEGSPLSQEEKRFAKSLIEDCASILSDLCEFAAMPEEEILGHRHLDRVASEAIEKACSDCANNEKEDRE